MSYPHPKACWYCKSTWLDEYRGADMNYVIKCLKCGTSMYFKDRQKLVDKWNEKYERAYE